MHNYLIVMQVLCGAFSAYVAGRKGRSRWAWFFIGTLVPVLGVVLALLAEQVKTESEDRVGPAGLGGRKVKARRPLRCCGSYIPDCQGCPHFRRQLFAGERRADVKGHCAYYGKDLTEDAEQQDPSLLIEDR